MSLDEREQSRARGEPVNLYLFSGAGGDATPFFAELEATQALGPFAYTDAEQPITRTEVGHEDPVVYQPITISRTAITASGTLDKASLEVRMEDGTDLAAMFMAYPPSQVINLFIRQGHIGDDPNDPDSFRVIWAGRLLGAQHPPNETVFNCEPVSTSMQRPGLRRNFQLSCPHVLYGPECRASMAAATVVSAPTAIMGNRVTLPADWNDKPVEKYRGGLIRWTAANGALVLRTIVRIDDGVTLFLGGPASELEVAQEVKVSLGCNHQPGLFDTTGDCKNLHNNILNYGGQPFIPLTNPVSSATPFY